MLHENGFVSDISPIFALVRGKEIWVMVLLLFPAAAEIIEWNILYQQIAVVKASVLKTVFAQHSGLTFVIWDASSTARSSFCFSSLLALKFFLHQIESY